MIAYSSFHSHAIPAPDDKGTRSPSDTSRATAGSYTR